MATPTDTKQTPDPAQQNTGNKNTANPPRDNASRKADQDRLGEVVTKLHELLVESSNRRFDNVNARMTGIEDSVEALTADFRKAVEDIKAAMAVTQGQGEKSVLQQLLKELGVFSPQLRHLNQQELAGQPVSKDQIDAIRQDLAKQFGDRLDALTARVDEHDIALDNHTGQLNALGNVVFGREARGEQPATPGLTHRVAVLEGDSDRTRRCVDSALDIDPETGESRHLANLHALMGVQEHGEGVVTTNFDVLNGRLDTVVRGQETMATGLGEVRNTLYGTPAQAGPNGQPGTSAQPGMMHRVANLEHEVRQLQALKNKGGNLMGSLLLGGGFAVITAAICAMVGTPFLMGFILTLVVFGLVFGMWTAYGVTPSNTGGQHRNRQQLPPQPNNDQRLRHQQQPGNTRQMQGPNPQPAGQQGTQSEPPYFQ